MWRDTKASATAGAGLARRAADRSDAARRLGRRAAAGRATGGVKRGRAGRGRLAQSPDYATGYFEPG
ncbi:hypothetical protein F01_280018 [Burkholderia cenocepacia]|nr:hypothetical protein F01_280018 [Burkholderia cenocepacia]